MRAFLLTLLLLQAGSASAADKAESPPAKSYKTTKTIAAVERCLEQELSDLGDPTFMRSTDSTTLMIRNGEAAPLLIEIAPPSVTITTKANYDTTMRVRRCL